MVGIVVATPQVSSTRRKIVRSRELVLINVPLRVNKDGGNRRRHATSIVYTQKNRSQ